MNAIPRPLGRASALALAAAALSVIPSRTEAQSVGPLGFHLIPSCRLWDTRGPVGVSGGPKLNANSTRCFPVHGLCSVPTTARAVSINFTAVGSTDLGNIRAYPGGGSVPNTSVLNFKGDGGAVANSGVVGVGEDGTICIRVDMPAGSTGQVHLIGDVFGYYAFP